MFGRSERLKEKHPKMRHEVAGHAIIRIVKKNVHRLWLANIALLVKKRGFKVRNASRTWLQTIKQVRKVFCAVSHIEEYKFGAEVYVPQPIESILSQCVLPHGRQAPNVLY